MTPSPVDPRSSNFDVALDDPTVVTACGCFSETPKLSSATREEFIGTKMNARKVDARGSSGPRLAFTDKKDWNIN